MSEEERYQNFIEAIKLLGVELPAERIKGVDLSIQLEGKYWIQVSDPYNRRQRIFELKQNYPHSITLEAPSSPKTPR